MDERNVILPLDPPWVADFLDTLIAKLTPIGSVQPAVGCPADALEYASEAHA